MAEGPSFDHFGDPYGYYMMTYGQLGSKEGAIATLKSPIFPGFDDNQCFHFHWVFNVRNHRVQGAEMELSPFYYIRGEQLQIRTM